MAGDIMLRRDNPAAALIEQHVCRLRQRLPGVKVPGT